MAHTVGGNTLYVTDDEVNDSALVAELEVINATSTVLQHFSKPSERRTLAAYVIGSSTYNSIRALSSGSSVAAYTSDVGSQGNYYLTSVNGKRLRGTPYGFSGSSGSDPIYNVTIQMIRA